MEEAAASSATENGSEGTSCAEFGEETGRDGFGAHIKRLREVRRLTQDELATIAGLAADTIRRLEHCEFSPSLRTLKKVVRGLNITLTSLFSSYELTESDIAREFTDLLATRPVIERKGFAQIWRVLADGLDARKANPTGIGVVAEVDPDAKPTKDPFGRHVRSLRRARGMTQEVLAEACGLSPDTIRRLEHGSFSPSLDTLTKLCSGLELSRSSLFLSFEEQDQDLARDVVDVLHRRPPADRELGLRMLRALYRVIDEVERAG